MIAAFVRKYALRVDLNLGCMHAFACGVIGDIPHVHQHDEHEHCFPQHDHLMIPWIHDQTRLHSGRSPTELKHVISLTKPVTKPLRSLDSSIADAYIATGGRVEAGIMPSDKAAGKGFIGGSAACA
jgi:hypothetical protein